MNKTGAQLTGEWPKFRYIIHNFSPKLRISIRAASRKNAVLVLREVKKGIREQSPGGQKFQPLNDLTVREKASVKGIGSVKSNSALIRYGDLLKAFEYSVDEKNGSFWVGIQKGKKNRSGTDLNMIARTMNYGMTVTVTPSLRNYFAATGRPLKKETTHLDIPARPFIEPVLKALQPIIIKNYIDAIDRVLKGKKGIGEVINND